MTLLNGHEPHELAPDRTGRRWGITVAEANDRLKRASKTGLTAAEAAAELRASFGTKRSSSGAIRITGETLDLMRARPRVKRRALRTYLRHRLRRHHMTRTLRVKLGPDETTLLGRLAEAHPGYLMRDECDPIALSNLRAIGCASPAAGQRVWINADGLALWDTLTPATQDGDTNS